MPIAYAIHKEKDLTIEILQQICQNATNSTEKGMGESSGIAKVLYKWIEYTPLFTNESYILCLMGLSNVFAATVKDKNFAAIPIKKDRLYSDSTETKPLQVKLVKCFVEFITTTEDDEQIQNEEYDNEEDDDEELDSGDEEDDNGMLD